MSKKQGKGFGSLGHGINIDQAVRNPPRSRSNQGRGPSGKPQQMKKEAPIVRLDMSAIEGDMPVSLPINYFRPVGTESVDIRVLTNVCDGQTNVQILSFTAPKSAGVFFTHYGMFTDILLASNVEFLPRVAGNRVLRYHGDPNDNFKLNLSISADLSDDAMIPCEIYLRPAQTITWAVTNNSGADGPMGVRMTGYVDTKTSRKYTDFGG